MIDIIIIVITFCFCEFPLDFFFTTCPKDLIPYTAHANYMVGRDAKENALKRIGMWFLPDDVDLS